ncbi:MAG: hypothetical protein EOO75_08745, partial [Myxococcales bacterium]
MGDLDLDPERLLRELTATIAAAQEIEEADRGMETPETVDPYRRYRLASNLSTLAELAKDPARPYVGAWVLWLLLGRTTLTTARAEAAARQQPGVRLELTEVSLRQGIRDLLGATTPDERRRVALAIEKAAAPAADAASELWMRRGEVLRHAGGEALWPLLQPLPTRADLDALAAHALDATDELAAHVLRAGHWSDALALGAGREDDVPWPRALTSRWLLAPFEGEARWLDLPSLSLGPLPAMLGGSSATRAMARLGARWADAAGSRQLPRPLAQLPSGLARLRTGALFASLLQSPEFLVRGLGQSRFEADRTRRQQARVALVALRLEAVRVRQMLAAIGGDRGAARSLGADQAGRALQVRWPADLALALPRSRPTSPARLLAFGLGALEARALRDAH